MSISIGDMTGLSSPEQLFSWLLDQSDPEHGLESIKHRRQVVQAWNIALGSRILEIGSGQGDFTVVLADAVGPTGHVTAIDPSPVDWGTPTINEAQAHLGQCPLGSRISYLNQDPSEYLDALPEATRAFDFIVFGHSIWFFPTPVILPVMLAKARRYARSVLVAEFSYSTKSPLAFPHILAAQYNNTLESTIQRGIWNIRCALTPPQICRLVEQAGWVKKEEQIVTQSAVLRDAWREVYMILRSKVFRRELDEAKISMGLKTVLSGMRDAVAASVQSLEGGLDAVRNMDVWVARFDEADTV